MIRIILRIFVLFVEASVQLVQSASFSEMNMLPFFAVVFQSDRSLFLSLSLLHPQFLCMIIA